MLNDNKKTPCECPGPGHCNRHGVDKSLHLYSLCQNHPGYFNLWEQCRGPKQNPNDCVKASSDQINVEAQPDSTPEPKTPVQLPSTTQMAKNFIASAAKHIQNGMQNVTDEQQQERLKICAGCEFAVEGGSRCGKCGCFLETKTKWASSSCPIGKW